MPEIFRLGRNCRLNPVVPEAPACDVMYGKHHHLQLEDSTISLYMYMLFTLGSATANGMPEKF